MKQVNYQINKMAEVNAYLHTEKKEYPAIVVCPGGAYLYVSNVEGKPVAEAFYEQGFQTFVLNYSTPFTALRREIPDITDEQLNETDTAFMYEMDKVPSNYPYPLLELAETISLLCNKADELMIDPMHIGIIGFSAGGNLTALFGNQWHEEMLKTKISRAYRPWFQVICYGVTALDQPYLDYLKVNAPNLVPMYQAFYNTENPDNETMEKLSPVYIVNKNTPPTFVWHTTDDVLVPVTQSLDYVRELNQQGIPWEAHFYEHGGHGLAVATEKIGRVEHHVAGWFPVLMDWLKRYRSAES